jgi:hypothetical protein
VKQIPEQTRQQIKEMAAQGFDTKQIMAATGICKTTVYRWMDIKKQDRQNAWMREYKRKKKGTCQDCGTTINYNGHHPGGIGKHCIKCSRKRTGLLQRDHGPVIDKVIEYLKDGEKRFSEMQYDLDIKRNRMGALLGKLIKHGKIIRVRRGVYQLVP